MSESSTVSPISEAFEKRRISHLSSRELVDLAVKAALDKKASDITVLDMRQVSGFADYFVLCTGDSDTQVRAIADGVQKEIKETSGERPWHVEGAEFRQWILVDYVDTVVHVFDRERRAFYGLERLWADAPSWDIDEVTGEPKTA